MLFNKCKRKELPISDLVVIESINATFTDMDELLFQALKDNIERDGLRAPIIVMNDEVSVVGGKHRLRAARELGQETISCIVLPEVPLQRAYEVGVLDNTLRRRLTSWEMAIAVNALYHVYGGRHGGSREEEDKQEAQIGPLGQEEDKQAAQIGLVGKTRDIVASLLGIGKGKVEFYHALGQLPQQIWEDLAAAKVTDSNLVALVHVVKDAKKLVKEGELTEHELENAIIATVRELIEFEYDTAWLIFKLSSRTGVIGDKKKKKDKPKKDKKPKNKWLALMYANRQLESVIDAPEKLQMGEGEVAVMVKELRTWSAKYLELAQKLEKLHELAN